MTYTKTRQSKPATLANGTSAMAIIGGLFFIFGFVTWLNSVLIPYLQIACELSHFQSYLVTFAFYIAYLTMAPVSTRALRHFGFKNGMAVGLAIMALGALLFIPAALSRTYLLFLAGLFVQGSGLAILQTAANPYVTVVGPAESAARRISIMGICNKLAGGTAPILLGAIMLEDLDGFKTSIQSLSAFDKAVALDDLATRVIAPYLAIILALAAMALLVYRSSLPEIDTDEQSLPTTANSTTGKRSVIDFPHLLLGVLALFLYVGVEVLAGDSIISYGSSQGISLEKARFFTGATMASMIVGYILGIIAIPKYLKQEDALKFCALVGVVFSVGAILTSGLVSVLFIALLGLANALMWPAIWPLALHGLGRFTKPASSLLVMGIAGGAVVPLIYGTLADALNPQQAYWVMVPCYLFIWYYAAFGHRVGRH